MRCRRQIAKLMNPTYFDSAARFRQWLAKHARQATELWVGYYKISTRKESLTWAESVDEALCYGWIDGLRRSVDAQRYMIRFTPRKAGSVWSAVNIKRVQSLIDCNRMKSHGLAAFTKRRENRSGIYSYEQRSTELPEGYRKLVNKHRRAATYFSNQPPSYRKAAIWWVVSAKQESTRLRRLAQLINDSENSRRIAQFIPRTKPQ